MLSRLDEPTVLLLLVHSSYVRTVAKVCITLSHNHEPGSTCGTADKFCYMMHFYIFPVRKMSSMVQPLDIYYTAFFLSHLCRRLLKVLC